MSKKKIRSTAFSPMKKQAYVALIGFFCLVCVFTYWWSMEMIKSGFVIDLGNRVLHGFLFSWIGFPLILIQFITPSIEIGDDYIGFPPHYKLSLKYLKFDEIREIEYEVTKHGRGVRGVWIIDKEGRKYEMRNLAARKELIETLREKMPTEEWKKKSNEIVLDKVAPT